MMQKKMVIVKHGKQDSTDELAKVLKTNGWILETIELSEGEPLPKSLNHVDGLLIVGSPINVYEQYSSPMQVYVG